MQRKKGIPFFDTPGAGCPGVKASGCRNSYQAIARRKSALSKVESVLVDGGYTGQPFANATDEILGATVQVAKRSELHTFAVIPQRWVVERSFAWLENCRRLWKNTERN